MKYVRDNQYTNRMNELSNIIYLDINIFNINTQCIWFCKMVIQEHIEYYEYTQDDVTTDDVWTMCSETTDTDGHGQTRHNDKNTKQKHEGNDSSTDLMMRTWWW